MRRAIRTLAFVAFAMLTVDHAPVQAAERVLFIGNSFTRDWGIARMVSQLAPVDTPAEIVDLSRNGASLSEHLGRDRVGREVAAGGWLAIVLQDFSDTALVPEKAEASVSAVAALLADAAASPRVFFAPWAPARTPTAERDAATRMIEAHYRRLAETHGGTLAPVGRAWRLTRKVAPQISLRAPDNHHATLAGAYLAALVIGQALYGETMSDWHPDSMTPARATRLRALAAEAARRARHPADRPETAEIAEEKHRTR